MSENTEERSSSGSPSRRGRSPRRKKRPTPTPHVHKDLLEDYNQRDPPIKPSKGRRGRRGIRHASPDNVDKPPAPAPIVQVMRRHGRPYELDAIQRLMGAMGIFQIWLAFLVFLLKIPIAHHQMAMLFHLPPINYNCNCSRNNYTDFDCLNETKWNTTHCNGTFANYSVYEQLYANYSNSSSKTNWTITLHSVYYVLVKNFCPCKNPLWIKDPDGMKYTAVMKWNLVCNRKWLRDFHQSMLQFGVLCGSLLFALWSDRCGRRWPILYAIMLLFCAGTIASRLENFWLFTFFRFLTGVAIGGLMVVSFVLLLEYAGRKYHELLSTLYQIPFNFGHISLAYLAYYMRDFQVLQKWISIPLAILFFFLCLLPESARWLLARKRTRLAAKQINKVAIINSLPTAEILDTCKLYQRTKAKGQRADCFSLFRTPNMRKNMLIMALQWFICGYCFYGLAQYVGRLSSGNLFMNVALCGLLCLVATLLSLPLMMCMGRKAVVIMGHLLCAICLIVVSCISNESAITWLVSVGSAAAFMVIVAVYLYCFEMFPTVVRNSAIAFSATMAWIGSMISPFAVTLSEYRSWLPGIVFGIPALIAAIACFFIPETKGRPLMSTLEQGEEFGKKY